MERAQHRKSKSASGIEGIQQIQKQKYASRLSSDSRYYNDGNAGNDMFGVGLGQSSLLRRTGTPMRKLLAEEMSKEVESKRHSPKYIARVMGLDRLVSPWLDNRQQKVSCGGYQKKNVLLNIEGNSQLYDVLPKRRSSVEQHEFKDVYEDLEASHITNGRCSSRWSASSMLTQSEMALIQQKFSNAKRRSAAKKHQGSKAFEEALEMLDCNNDSLNEFLEHPDSLFLKHLRDLYDDPASFIEKHKSVLTPPNSAKYEANCKAWNSERNTSGEQDINSRLKRKDGLLLEPDNQIRASNSHKSSKIHLEEKKEENIIPTRIVLLKPSLGMRQNADMSGSSADLSHGVGNMKRTNEYPSVGGTETVLRRRQYLSDSVGSSKPISEVREIAKKIVRMLRDSCDETLEAKSSRSRGYAGDESLHQAIKSDSDNEPDLFELTSGKYGDHKLRSYQSCSLAESTANREAKQRISERWKMTQRYQDLELVSNGSTLGEVLRLPGRETTAKQLNAKTSLGRASHRLDSNNGTGIQYGSSCISGRDGRKDGPNKTSSRSRSLPPSIGGRSPRSSSHHDELAEGKHLMCSDSTIRGRSKVGKGDLSHKEEFSSNDSKSRDKRPLPHQHMFVSATDSSSEIKMEANIKEDISVQHPMFQLAAKDETSKSPVFDMTMIAEHGSPSLSSKSFEFLPKESSLVVDDEKSDAHDQEYSSLQELQKGLPERGSPLQSLGGERNSCESSKEACHPSPVSVLEVPFTEDTSSSSESFERVSAELHGLQMQLQLLKVESGTSADASTLVLIDEEVTQLPPIIFGGNYTSATEHWETYYALDVLIDSGLDVPIKKDSGLDDSCFELFKATWHSPECPLGPKLFNNLEKLYSDKTIGTRLERRLLFDRVNLALIEIFQDHVNLYPTPRKLKTELQKDGIRVALEKLIDQENVVRDERWLDRETLWSDCKREIDDIGNEIEKVLIDGMIAEIICN